MNRSRHSAHYRARHQSGQAMVLIALMAVALIGMLGVAIDGGGLYFLHRDTQNAADAAALAALYTKCTSYPIWSRTAVEASGEQAALSNGFADSETTVVAVWPNYLPPDTYDVPTGFTRYVRVDITAPKPAYFIQIVYPGPLEVTSTAIGFCEPSLSNVLPQGMAIVSLRPQGCIGGGGDDPSFRVTGNAGVFVHNSSIFVNSSDPTCALWVANNGQLEVDGACAVVGGIDGEVGDEVLCGSIVHPEPLWSTHPLQDVVPPDEACDPSPVDVAVGPHDSVELSPGHYGRIRVQGELRLNPGIYCIEELRTNSGGALTGDNVLIYMPPGHNGWDATALSTVEMNAAGQTYCTDPAHEDEEICVWQGLLIWADISAAEAAGTSVVSDIHINGGNESRWTGMIYGPRSECRIEGQGEGWGINSQIVCWSVDLNGGSQLDIVYDPPAFLMTAPRVSLTS